MLKSNTKSMKNKISVTIPFSEMVVDEFSKDTVSMKLYDEIAKKLYELYKQDMRIRIEAGSLVLNQDLYVFTHKELVDFIELMQYPEHRVEETQNAIESEEKRPSSRFIYYGKKG